MPLYSWELRFPQPATDEWSAEEYDADTEAANPQALADAIIDRYRDKYSLGRDDEPWRLLVWDHWVPAAGDGEPQETPEPDYVFGPDGIEA